MSIHFSDSFRLASGAKIHFSDRQIIKITAVEATFESLDNAQSFGDLVASESAADFIDMIPHVNDQSFSNIGAVDNSQSASITSFQNGQAFDGVGTLNVQSASIDSLENSQSFGGLAGQITGQSITVDSFLNHQQFGDFSQIGSQEIESFINIQSFGDIDSYSSIGIDGLQNLNSFGGVEYWQEFVPQNHHVKLYGARIGDLDLSNRVTAVGGNKNSDHVYLSLTIAGVDLIDDIQERSAATIELYAYYKNQLTGATDKETVLMQVAFDRLQYHRGGWSGSLVLTGRGDFVAGITIVKTVPAPEYISSSQWRVPVDLDLNVGDVAVYGDEQITVGAITYTIGPMAKFMTLSV